jgi:two-component system sensor histidine kinase SenX3
VLIAALVVALVVALGCAAALLVAQRAAVARVTAASQALVPAASPVERGRPRSLDAALDDLEATVAESVAARRRTARGEDRLSWALGAIGHGVVIFDHRGEVAYRNDPAATFLAARHSDALVEEAINALAADALRGRQATRELELYGPPRRVLQVRAVPLEDPARPSGALVVVEDASERRHLENVRRDFVANISHELKTPVGALALLAETLLDETDPAVAKRLATRLATEAFRVGRTIDDLLELSRLEAATEGLGGERLAVARVVAEAVDRVRPAAEQRGIEVEDGEIAPGLCVVGERRQLVSAVANLVDNAVKYSEPGSTVSVRARTDGEWVDVVVRDRGIGIPRRDLERIFERFYRVDRARSRETGGTGLGLAIVRHVASNHRGEVRVESREGAGSTFTLRLPAGAPLTGLEPGTTTPSRTTREVP